MKKNEIFFEQVKVYCAQDVVDYMLQKHGISVLDFLYEFTDQEAGVVEVYNEATREWISCDGIDDSEELNMLDLLLTEFPAPFIIRMTGDESDEGHVDLDQHQTN